MPINPPAETKPVADAIEKVTAAVATVNRSYTPLLAVLIAVFGAHLGGDLSIAGVLLVGLGAGLSMKKVR